MKDYKDKFEKGIFWELYNDLEKQFENYLEYVPYLKDAPGGKRPKGNERVYSFKLLNLILSIGGHVDSVFKEMARYEKFQDAECRKFCREIRKKVRLRNSVPIYLPLNALEKEYELSKRRVIFKCLPQREVVTPFALRPDGNNIPEWWTVYNGLKHDLSLNIKKANLRNARDALAGAFLLNVVHKPSIRRLYFIRVAKPKYGGFFVTYEKNGTYEEKPSLGSLNHILKDTIYPPLLVETPIFFFDYEQWDEKIEGK